MSAQSPPPPVLAVEVSSGPEPESNDRLVTMAQDRPDERIGMEYDVPEPYRGFLSRTGLKPDLCTFCKRQGLDTPPAFIVLRRWQGRKLGQLLTYCDELHHFDPEHGFFGRSGERLRPVCPVHLIELPSTGVCDYC